MGAMIYEIKVFPVFQIRCKIPNKLLGIVMDMLTRYTGNHLKKTQVYRDRALIRVSSDGPKKVVMPMA
jgi:hypothetical protein